MKYLYLVVLTVIVMSCNNSQNEKSTDTTADAEIAVNTLSEGERVAQKSGLEQWDNVKQIDFTFNVDRNGEQVSKRSWSWQPKSGDVRMINQEDTLVYNHKAVDSASIQADRAFINDKYWLLAPYQIVWDRGATIQEKDSIISPLTKRTSKMLTLTYNEEGGYTPGDAYDFYYGDDYKITEWVFRKGNADEPSMITTFEDYKQFNGIEIATVHKNEDGNFKLYFTDIKVQKE